MPLVVTKPRPVVATKARATNGRGFMKAQTRELFVDGWGVPDSDVITVSGSQARAVGTEVGT